MRFKERNDFIGQWIFLGSVTNWLGAGHTCTYLKEACFYCRHASERPHIVWSHASLPVHLVKAFKVAANIQPTRGNRAYKEHYGGQVRHVPGVLLLLGDRMPLLCDRCFVWLWQPQLEDSTGECMCKGLLVTHHLPSHIPKRGRPNWKLVCSGCFTQLTHTHEPRIWF